jgi:hypothetical protein
LAVSPDGAFVVAGTRENSGNRLTILPANGGAAKLIETGRCHDLAFTADGKRLVALIYDWAVYDFGFDLKSWEVGTWKEVPVRLPLSARERAIGSMLRLSPDGSRVAFRPSLREPVVWDLATGALTKLNFHHDDEITPSAFSADGRQLIVTPAHASRSPKTKDLVRIDLSSGSAEPFFTFERSPSLWGLELTPDGRFVHFQQLPKDFAQQVVVHKCIEVATGRERWSDVGPQRRLMLSPGAVFASFLNDREITLCDMAGLVDERWADLAPSIARARDAKHDVELIAGKVHVTFARKAGVGELDSLIKALPIIDSLSIVRDDLLEPSWVDPLGRLPDLKELHLGAPVIGDRTLALLATLKGLAWLKLKTDRLTDAGLAQLHVLSNLRTLELTGTTTTPDAISRLRKALPNTTIIGVADQK